MIEAAETTTAAPTAPVELTIVMPCLNEAETLATCIQQARAFFDDHGVDGEVLIADNGSTDGSQQIARDNGARVVDVPEKGYGAALIGGIAAARGRFVAMGDADDSYDFGTLGPFLERLRAGDDLVMGNRFLGGIAEGAMPPLHRYLGNPVLSFVGRLFFRTPAKDFHCGLRAFNKESIRRLELRTTGMEFASEMVVKASLADLRVSEVPTTLRPDGRTRPPHLRSWRDGWRHLRFLLLYSPRWLFFYPGLLLMALGLVTTGVLLAGTFDVGGLGLDVGTMQFGLAATIVGYQGVIFSVLSRVYAAAEGLLPPGSDRFRAFEQRLNFETGIVVGLTIFLAGVAMSLIALLNWGDADFGRLDAAASIRMTTPAVLGLVVGAQTIMAGLFISLLRVRVSRPAPMVQAQVAQQDS